MDMIDRLISREGGATVVNNPNDPGGLTKYGISQAAYPQLDIKNLTYDEARAVYTRDYYLSPGLNKLPEPLQENVLDFCVHSGVQSGIEYLQKVLGVQRDGIIGQVTIDAASKYPPQQILKAYQRERILYMARQVVSNPKKLGFLVGWLARVLSI